MNCESCSGAFEHQTLTIIYGTSGLGKTSLLQAGLIPRLREAGYLPVTIRLGYTTEDPSLSRQVIDELRAALQSAGRNDLAGFTSESISFWELFHDPTHGMIRADGSAMVRLVLVFDQFEEIYTRGEHRRADTESFREDRGRSRANQRGTIVGPKRGYPGGIL